jgi:hypothetical protein
LLDGAELREITDDTYKYEGKAGLWLKSRAQTHSDEFNAEG